MIWVSATANRSSKARHCGTRTAGTTRVKGWPQAWATASATYDLPRPTSSASRAPPWRAMIAVSRWAAGTWCGASQAGQVEDGVIAASGAPSSSARAALATTARGDVSPAPPAPPGPPGARATVRGSATGTRCSERIRGQRATVGGIELEGIGDEIVGALAAFAAASKLCPHRRLLGRYRQAAHDAGVEAAKTTAGGIGDEARERGEPDGIEQGGQRRGVRRVTRGDAVDGVERHELRGWHRRGEATAQIGPYHAMCGEPETGSKQLPRWPGFVVGTPAQSLLVAREPLGDRARQSRKRLAIGAVRPEQVAARPAAPRGDVAPTNGRPRSGTLTVEKEEVVSARLDAELRRPAITDGWELCPQPPADPRRTRREDPRSAVLQLALWDRGCCGLRAEGSGCQLRPRRVGPCCNQGHRIDCRVEHAGDRLRQGRRAPDARVLSQPPAQRLVVAAGRELGGNEQGNDAARASELECAFRESDGKIGQVGKAASCNRTPAGVARG